MINQHISKADLATLRGQLAERYKCRKEIAIYPMRIAYLEKLLKIPKAKKSRRANPA